MLTEIGMSEKPTVSLHPTQDTDVDFVVTAENAPDNTTFISKWTKEQHLENLLNPNFCYFTIINVENRTPLGYVILEGLSDENHSVNIKRIVVTAKGLGIGRMAIEQVKNFAFNECQAHRLWLDVKTFNSRAQHLYMSEGFKVEGTLRECIKSGDHYDSLTVMSILKSEYILHSQGKR